MIVHVLNCIIYTALYNFGVLRDLASLDSTIKAQRHNCIIFI